MEDIKAKWLKRFRHGLWKVPETNLDIIRMSDVIWGKNFNSNFAKKQDPFKGLVVHYTASPRFSAKAVCKYFATLRKEKSQIACPVMNGDGKIYVSKDWNIFEDRASHAGRSEWEGNRNISNTFAGIEVCCKGRSEVELHDLRSDYRLVYTADNMKRGNYEMFTQHQEMKLVQLCLILDHEIKEFDLNNVVGHDEIAPDRKSDPGGSLSATMPQFREILFYIKEHCPLHEYFKYEIITQ